MWKSWQESLIVVKPDTVVQWHRKGFALYWTRLSRENQIGRAGTGKEIGDLIRKIASANPLWGCCYWYQTEPYTDRPPLQPPAERIPVLHASQ